MENEAAPFEVGGIYAPYDCSRSPSVESGEVSEDEDASPPTPPASLSPPRERASATTRPSSTYIKPTQFSSVMLVRLRKTVLRVGVTEWFEFLMERRGEVYQFPQIPGDRIEPLIEKLVQRRLLRDELLRTLQTYYITSETSGKTTMHVFMLPLEKTQQLRNDRKLIAPPNFYWMCESQLATHSDVGPPSAFGIPIAPWTLATFYALPPSMRYASPTPPLVLYHGTDASAAPGIATGGLKPAPRKDAMLGPGVYFGRWDKARDFATHDASNDVRATPGVVVRCIVVPGPTLTMQASMRCTCGCGKPFVDHSGDHSRGYRTVFIADNSIGATRRAEWCVKEPDAIHVDGIFGV